MSPLFPQPSGKRIGLRETAFGLLRISSFSDYGRLSGTELDHMRSEVSTTYDYYDKDNSGDFALFKRSTLAELNFDTGPQERHNTLHRV